METATHGVDSGEALGGSEGEPYAVGRAGGGGDTAAGGDTGGERHVQQGEQGPRLRLVVAFDAAGAVQGGGTAGLDQGAGEFDRLGLPPGRTGRDPLGVGVRDGDVAGRAEPEDRLEQGVRVLVALT